MKVRCKKLKSESKHKKCLKRICRKKQPIKQDHEIGQTINTNNVVFSQIKNAFDRALRDPDFKKKNEELHFKQKDGKILEYSIPEDKLRKKYANLKTSWNKISDRAKNRSDLSPIREPNWFHILNEIYAENKVDLNLVSSAKDIRLT